MEDGAWLTAVDGGAPVQATVPWMALLKLGDLGLWGINVHAI
jgi:hypothetical protein